MYFETHNSIKKIPKYCKKFHLFSLFEVLYNWVKFRRLKMGDPVYNRGKVLESAHVELFCPLGAMKLGVSN